MEKRESPSDQIDLQELLLNGILLIKRNFLQFLISFVVGSLLGYTYSMFATKVYESKMVISSDILNKLYVEELGDNINKILADDNIDLLANKFGINAEIVRKIRSVKLESIEINKVIPSTTGPTFISITVLITDLKILPDVQKGIVNYLENNDFVKVRIGQRRNTYLLLIAKIQEEILSLEKFKTEFYNGEFLKNSGNIMFDPTSVNSKIIQLTTDVINYRNALSINNSIQVIEGFTEFKNAKKPNKVIALAGGASMGLLFITLLLAFKTIRKFIAIAERKSN